MEKSIDTALIKLGGLINLFYFVGKKALLLIGHYIKSLNSTIFNFIETP